MGASFVLMWCCCSEMGAFVGVQPCVMNPRSTTCAGDANAQTFEPVRFVGETLEGPVRSVVE